jgi:hypothetical protein
MTSDERTDVEDLEEELGWAVHAEFFGVGYIYILACAIERGDADVGIHPSAWENTMSAVEWAMMEQVHGRIQGPTSITVEDVERMRRLHTLGSAALSGGERLPELRPLALQCLESVFGPDWERVACEAAHGMREFVQEPPL